MRSVLATACSTTICYIPWQYDSALQQSLVTVHSARLQPHGSAELEHINNCDPKAQKKKEQPCWSWSVVPHSLPLCSITLLKVLAPFRLCSVCTVHQPSFMLHFILSSCILSGPNMKITGDSDCESGFKLQLCSRTESSNKLKWLWTESLITRCNKRVTLPPLND